MSTTGESFQESAAAQALRIPHIVTAVLRFLHYHRSVRDDKALRACTLVNTLFEAEASRLLWEECTNFTKPAHRRALERLSRIQPPSRLQKLANYIRRIDIDYYYHDPIVDQGKHTGSYLDQLRDVSFPLLESLTLRAPDTYYPKYPLLPLYQFAQPGLRQLHIYVNNGNPCVISEEFLQQLQQCSKGIKQLLIKEDDPYGDDPLESQWRTFSSDTITSFLEAFQSLESLTWKIEGLITKSAFRALSRCTELKTLCMCPIQYSWLSDPLPESAFSALRYLGCKISSRTLTIFVPFLEQIEELLVEEIDETSGSIWKVIVNARFQHLKALRIHFHPDTVIQEDELLSIGYYSPQLHTLTIWAATDHEIVPFTIENFSNETIQKLAKQLPALTELQLAGYSGTSVLDEDSLILLGQHCPLLKSFSTYARVDWERLVSITSVNEWPNLENLNILVDPHGDERQGSDIDVRELAVAVLQRMPLLDSVTGGAIQLWATPMLEQALWQVAHGKSRRATSVDRDDHRRRSF